MKKCVVCKKYTLEDVHCNKPTIVAHPPKFKINDVYGKYRRMARNKE
ncbi:ribosome biogenesis protein [Candidatus Micrarchaeota archaeon]|nr:ribosome biogenesis protein [Candidatus Micrarchaeota archaeon]